MNLDRAQGLGPVEDDLDNAAIIFRKELLALFVLFHQAGTTSSLHDMANQGMQQMPSFGAITPILRMFDEDKARAFYIDYLGFQVEFEHRFDDDAPLYMGLSLGSAELHLSEHHGDSTPGARVRIETRDLAGYWRELDAKSYRYAKPGPPQAQPWGEADLTIADPFGNKLTFFERGS